MKRVLIFDNYDSFTHNIAHIVRALGYVCDIYRNDQISLDQVGQYDKIILSPGPGIPAEAGILLEVIRTYAPTKSILGICLGEQAIGEAFGATLDNLTTVYHGVESMVSIIAPDPLFVGLGEQVAVGRYHSWIVNRASMPEELVVTAVDEAGEVMALRHRRYDVCGVQFHPESVLTPEGGRMIENFLKA